MAATPTRLTDGSHDQRDLLAPGPVRPPRDHTAIGTAVCGVGGIQVALAMPAGGPVLIGVAGAAGLFLLLIIVWHVAGSGIALTGCVAIAVAELAYWIGGGERRAAPGAVVLLAVIVLAWFRTQRSR